MLFHLYASEVILDFSDLQFDWYVFLPQAGCTLSANGIACRVWIRGCNKLLQLVQRSCDLSNFFCLWEYPDLPILNLSLVFIFFLYLFFPPRLSNRIHCNKRSPINSSASYKITKTHHVQVSGHDFDFTATSNNSSEWPHINLKMVLPRDATYRWRLNRSVLASASPSGRPAACPTRRRARCPRPRRTECSCAGWSRCRRQRRLQAEVRFTYQLSHFASFR